MEHDEEPVSARPRGSTWIRKRRIVTFWVLAVVFLAAGCAWAASPWLLLAFVPGLLFAYIAVIVTLTHRQFSRSGGGWQDRIHEMLLSHRACAGDTVDIGCGSGSLLIRSARADSRSRHVGVDAWGSDWEYSLAQCKADAQREGVSNVEFVKASAARTGLPDRSFACVLSCLTFHEVRDTPDKLAVMGEALRLLQPGGCFVFLDLFDGRKFFPDLGALRAAVREAGCDLSTDTSLREVMDLPFPLMGKKALGYARLLCGSRKRD
jgi:SAM-dependent methyltransferase